MPKRVEMDPVTREWCLRAKAAFDARGRGSQQECAEKVRCSPGTISQLLKGKNTWSRFVVPISTFLGIAPPTMRVSDRREVEILTGVARLISAGLDRRVELIRQVVAELVSSVPHASDDDTEPS